MMKRFRTAQTEGDMTTAYRLLGSFEQLLHATEAPSDRATRKLNDWVSFVVLPLFALSNAGVTFSGGAAKGVADQPYCLGNRCGTGAGQTTRHRRL